MSVDHAGHPPKEWEGWESHLVHFHNFASLPSGKGEWMESPEFSSFGHKWRVIMYPGGHSEAEVGNISLYLELCSEEISLFNSICRSREKVAEQSLSSALLLTSLKKATTLGVGMIFLCVI